jgi:hypothetical protein
VIARNLLEPAIAAAARVQPAVAGLCAWLGEQRLGGGRGDEHSLELARLRADFEALTRSAANGVAGEFRFTAAARATLGELVACVGGVPESIDCLVLAPEAGLAQGKLLRVPLRSHVEALIRHLVPPIDLAARAIATAQSQLPRRIDDAMQREWSLIETRLDAGQAELVVEHAMERLVEARRALDDVAAATVRTLDAAMGSLHTALDAAFAGFEEDVLAGPTRDGHREARLQHWLGAARNAAEAVARRVVLALSGPAPLGSAEAIRHWLQSGSTAGLPPAIESWFDASPVTDDRIFAGHRRLLDYVLDAESSRAEAGRASVLVVGTRGAGKTSLLNLCEVELPRALHLRLHASEFGRDVTLLEAAGTLLDCPPTLTALTHQLEERAPAVFVDDLPVWISARPDRHWELDRILRLVTQTSHRAFWIVSIEISMLRLFRELVPLQEAFTHVLRLPPLGRSEIERLVASRLEIAGLDVTFASRRLTSILDALRSTPPGARFHHRLWRMSRGHPGRAVALCRRAFATRGHALTLAAEALEDRRRLTFDFSPLQLALLATLHRYGPQPLDRIAAEVGVTLPEVWRSGAFLMAAGLVEMTADGATVDIASAAHDAVREALSQARLAVE